MTICTRFAPSPTGYLHIGGARTALFAWLFARHHHGQFILRIEDTDRQRSTQASVDAILEGMKWLGLDYDQGPFYQTERMERYINAIEQLLMEGHAYRCYCNKARLEQLRERQIANKQKPRYDGHCRNDNLPHRNDPYVIRFKNPIAGAVRFEDQVYGAISVSNSELDDLIIQRSDGMPTYNFTVVIDDWDMEITHVVRGDDHINNTPRQINILTALNAKVPVYAHVPMILGPDGARLSKRHGAVSVLQYRDEGYLPEALLNYLVRLGWSHGDQEIFSLPELIEKFELKAINRAASSINPEKLVWLNQHYLKTLSTPELTQHLSFYFDQEGIDTSAGPSLDQLIQSQAQRSKTLIEIVEKSRYFYQEIEQYNASSADKFLTQSIVPALNQVSRELSNLDDWTDAAIADIVKNTVKAFGLKFPALAQALRVALTGDIISPPINETILLLGKAKTIQRITQATHFIDKIDKMVDKESTNP